MKSTNRGSQARKSPFTSPLISRQRPRTRLLGAWNLSSEASSVLPGNICKAAQDQTVGLGCWAGLAGSIQLISGKRADNLDHAILLGCRKKGWVHSGVSPRTLHALEGLCIGLGERLQKVLSRAADSKTKIKPKITFTWVNHGSFSAYQKPEPGQVRRSLFRHHFCWQVNDWKCDTHAFQPLNLTLPSARREKEL